MENLILTALGWTLLHSLWHGLVLFILLKTISYFFRPLEAKYAFILYFSALLLLIAGFFFTLTSKLQQSAVMSPDMMGSLSDAPLVFTLAEQTLSPNQSFFQGMEAFLPYLAGLYMAGLLLVGAKFAWDLKQTYSLKTQGLQLIPKNLQLIMEGCQRQLALNKAVIFRLSEKITIPMTIGYFKPIVLFPIACLTQLNPDEIEQIILHELGHIRRHDYLFKFLQMMIKTILYFNPFCHWICREMDLQREMACDQLVLAHKTKAMTYAQTLLKLESTKIPFLSPVNTLISKQNQLFTRIKKIMETKKQPTSTWHQALGLLSIICFGCFMFWMSKPITAHELPLEQLFAESPLEITVVEPEAWEPIELVPVFEEAKEISITNPVVQLQSDTTEKLPARILIILDGKPITQEEMRQIPPSDIANLNVIKGEAAITKYGAQATEGVIEITSRQAAEANPELVRSRPILHREQPLEGKELFSVAEHKPKFIAQEIGQWLNENLQYPAEAIAQKIEGVVYTTFIITETGEVIQPKIIRGVHPLLDMEALRLIASMPAWEPAHNNNHPVNIIMNLPVRFQLPRE